MLCYSFSISIYGEKNEKERYRTRIIVSVDLPPFVYVRFYFTLFFDGRCRNVYDCRLLFFT